MTRIEFNQWLIDHFSFESYLEIGCFGDDSFRPVRCARKVGVDPASGGTHRMTSDEFFAGNTERFDLVFIDGNHDQDFVSRDIANALRALTPRGIITLHDCWPPNAGYESLNMCGTGWRALAWQRQAPHTDVGVGDFDFGVGVVVQRSNTDPVVLSKPLSELRYADMTPKLMRLLGEEDLKKFVIG